MLRSKQFEWVARYRLLKPPELTEEIASSQWEALNALLHSLITLQSDLRDRRPIELILQTVSRLVAAERGVIYLQARADGILQAKGSFGFEHELPRQLCSMSLLAEAALRCRNPLLVSQPGETHLEEELRLLGARHCLSVPILRRGEAWGAVLLLRPVPFLEEEAVLVWLYLMILEEMLPGLAVPGWSLASSTGSSARSGVLEVDGLRSLCEWEVERSALVNQPFSLLRVSWSGGEAGAVRANGSRTRRIVQAIRRSLRSVDQIGRVEGFDLVISLPGMDEEEARDIGREIRRNLIALRALAEGETAGSNLLLSAVSYPAHGRTPEELFSALQRVVDSARNQPNRA